jgi:hypothetical protein
MPDDSMIEVEKMRDCERKFTLLTKSVELRGKLLNLISNDEVKKLARARMTITTACREYAYPYSTHAEWDYFRDTMVRCSGEIADIVIRVLDDIHDLQKTHYG